MAKGGAMKGGSSKVRLIVFEADIADGDLSQVTHVLQNAFKSSQPSPKVVQIASPPSGALGQPANGEDVIDAESSDVDIVASPPRAKVTRKPKVAKTPTVVSDVDFNSTPSLTEFVSQYDVKTNVDRYLVIALWFRDAREIDSVNVDQVYTAFKLLSWSTNMNDFEKTMRNLRDEQAFQGGSKEGYKLTLPGAAKVEKKKR